MEHLSESLRRNAVSISAKDPYAISHELLHWAARHGRVVECENRILTTGPRTKSEVKFYIEREFDKFTHMHMVFNLAGDVSTASLSAVMETELECSLPTQRGVATSAFNDFYLARLWPAHLRLARQLSEEIIGSALERLKSE